MSTGAQPYLTRLAADAVCVWFAFWGIRRTYDLDYKLDNVAQAIRWFVVGLSFALALVPGSEYKVLRILVGVLILAFLAWPNFAYHLTALLRRLGLAPKAGVDNTTS